MQLFALCYLPPPDLRLERGGRDGLLLVFSSGSYLDVHMLSRFEGVKRKRFRGEYERRVCSRDRWL